MPFRMFQMFALLVIAACSLADAATVLHFAPNPVDPLNRYTSSDELLIDSNRRLNQNYLLYLDTPGCAKLTEIAWNMRPNEQRSVAGLVHTSPFARAIFGEEYINGVATEASNAAAESMPCAAVCLDIGSAHDLVAYPMPQKVHRARYDHFLADKVLRNVSISEDEETRAYDVELEYAQWLARDCQSAEVGFVNWSNRTATIFWVNHHGELAPVGRLEGQGREPFMQWRNTVLGHSFVVLADDTDEVLLNETVRHDVFFPIGDAGSVYTILANEKKQSTREYTDNALGDDVMRTFDAEYQRSTKVTRRFSALGFDKGRLPNHLWQSIGTFYYNNRNNKVREEWERDGKGLYVNWWEVNAYMVTMPHNLKKTWQQELLPLMEAWAGVELELTDIYGMRRYEDGARLLTHVDREATHAASLIINVAQGEIREPWPVEIYDHANRLHQVVMAEGDIVYYESAKCLHGRMAPLQGGFYVNLFAHYRPKDAEMGHGDPKWFSRPNPPAVPPISFDTDPALVPFLALAAPELRGPQTLFDWWASTAHRDKAALAAIQERQSAQHEAAVEAFARAVYKVNTGREGEEAGPDEHFVHVLDFEDGYFDDEEDVPEGEEGEGEEEELWEGMGQEGHDHHEHRGQHSSGRDLREPTPADFDFESDGEGEGEGEGEEGQDGEGEESWSEHDHGHEHEGEEEEGEHDLEHEDFDQHGHEHDQHEHDGHFDGHFEGDEDEGGYEPEPEVKDTYNPYEMPEGHEYFLPAEEPSGQFLSDEQLREMGYGGGGEEEEEGEGWDPYGSEEGEDEL